MRGAEAGIHFTGHYHFVDRRTKPRGRRIKSDKSEIGSCLKRGQGSVVIQNRGFYTKVLFQELGQGILQLPLSHRRLPEAFQG